MTRGRVESWTRIGLLAAAALALWVGWRAFWFQCDDAYIAFRYVSNSLLGFGYTWNPPPFLPVEGYTSFLWVGLLDIVWRATGIEPPVSANLLALLFSYASLALIVAMALRLTLPPGLARHRTVILFLVLVGVLSNRTFLAWTSSGLETALFGALLLGWVYLAWFAAGGRGAQAGLATMAGLLALARPDGLLFAAATAGMLVARGVLERPSAPRAALLPALPLLVPVLHLAWRRATYGYWLPNTYYAKHVAAWPEAGVLYAAAFVLEYAYWVWLALALMASLVLLREGGGSLAARVRAADPAAITRILVVATLLAHCAYYTLVVGGDHFEFRVYQPLVPLILLSFPALAARAGLSARAGLAAFVAMLALGSVIPWTHWSHTHGLLTRDATFHLHFRVAPVLPAPLSWYAAPWDRIEGWLVAHLVGLRHQEHKIFGEHQRARFPPREEGSRIGGEEFPVFVFKTVGVPGWVLPHVAIIDVFGLNDQVIAHAAAPAPRGEVRQMAHDRHPPAGYVECFRPNVSVDTARRAHVMRRDPPLTGGAIRACESRFLAR